MDFPYFGPQNMDFPNFGPDRAFGSNLGRSETQTPLGNSGGLTEILDECVWVHK